MKDALVCQWIFKISNNVSKHVDTHRSIVASCFVNVNVNSVKVNPWK